jgi:hypothetical protein
VTIAAVLELNQVHKPELAQDAAAKDECKFHAKQDLQLTYRLRRAPHAKAEEYSLTHLAAFAKAQAWCENDVKSL